MAQYLESTLIKKPYQKMSYSDNQLLEFAKCADPVTGPHYFLSNYFWVQCSGKVKYSPYLYQDKLIDTYHNNRWSISLLPRQSGKTVTAAGYLLWYAMFNSNQTILIAAHKFLGASEIMNRIKFGYEAMPDFIRAGISEYNKQSITFDNGSKIAAQTTTENTGRGMSINLLYIDELAFIKRQQVAREMWTSVGLTLSATGGKAIITSTPNNSDDLFAEIWNGANKVIDEQGFTIPGGVGVNGFKAFRAYWYEHPERDDAWAAMWLKKIGEERFAREIRCEFVTYEETLISPIKLSILSGIEPIEKQGQIRWYKKPEVDKSYIVALDPSIGTGGDPAAIQVLEAQTKIQIAEWCNNKTPVESQVKILKEITTYLSSITGVNNVYFSVENNTLGEAILVAIRDIGEENIPGNFISESVKLGQAKKFRKGFLTTNTSKLAACAKLKQMVESDILKIFSKKLISELKTFISSGSSYAAKVGETDDLVLSMLLALRMLDQIRNYVPNMDNCDREINLPLPFIMRTY
jgi:hypothetical protein